MFILLCCIFLFADAQQMPDHFRQIATKVLDFPDGLSEDGLRSEWKKIDAANYFPKEYSQLLENNKQLFDYVEKKAYLNGISAQHYYDEYQVMDELVDGISKKTSFFKSVIYTNLQKFLVTRQAVLADICKEDPAIALFLKEQEIGIYTAKHLRAACESGKINLNHIFYGDLQQVNVQAFLRELDNSLANR